MESSPVGPPPPPPPPSPGARRPRPITAEQRRERLAGVLGLAVIVLFLAGGAALRQTVNGRVERGRGRCLNLLLQALRSGGAAAFREASGCYTDLLRAKPFSGEFAFRAQACEDLGGHRTADPAAGKGALGATGPEFQAAFGDLAEGRFDQAAARFAALGRGEGPDAQAAARYGDLAADLARQVAGAGGAE